MRYLFRYSVTIVLLPCLIVYIHGISVIWLIYQFEWEDIVTHHCQQYSLEECDGKQYINFILDAAPADAQRLPQPPATVDELRAMLQYNNAITAPQVFCSILLYSLPEATHRGFRVKIFHPPC